MIFRIVDNEKDGKLQLKLSCGEIFFKKTPSNLVVFISCIILIGILIWSFTFVKDISNKDEWFWVILLGYVSLSGFYILAYSKYTYPYNHEVIMTASEEGIEIKSFIKYNLEPIFIDRINIEDIYIEQQEIDYSSGLAPLAIDKTKKIYRIILSCKKPLYLKLGDKYQENFVLFADTFNKKVFTKSIEPQVKIIRDKLNLSKPIEYKVLKEKFICR